MTLPYDTRKKRDLEKYPARRREQRNVLVVVSLHVWREIKRQSMIDAQSMEKRMNAALTKGLANIDRVLDLPFPHNVERKRLTLWVPKDLHLQLKLATIDHDCSMQGLASACIEAYFVDKQELADLPAAG